MKGYFGGRDKGASGRINDECLATRSLYFKIEFVACDSDDYKNNP